MPIKKIFILLNFLFFALSYSQIIEGKIIDKQNNLISSARIGVENSEIGDLSDENGNFKIDFSNIDKNGNLKIFVSEFKPFKISISEFINSNREIVLTEKVINIEPIVINPKKYKFKNFGTTTKSKGAYAGYNSEDKERLFNEYAIFVKNSKHLKIKKINLNISHFDVEESATLIFDIQNSTNGFPSDSKSLTNETLKLIITKNDIINNSVSFDINDKNIWTNEDFFVLVRVDEKFKGKLYFSGNVFAFSKDTYTRNYYGKWQKYSTGEPSINVDVQIEK